MHICYIGDAGSIHVIKWAGYFVSRGYRVSIISDVEGEAEGAEVFNIGECLPDIHIKYLSAAYQIYKKRKAIKSILKRIKPDLIHAHYATNYGFLAAVSGYHPRILTFHGSDMLVDYSRDRISKFFVTYALKKADIVTAPSETITKKIISLRPDNIYTFQYGIDTNRFKCYEKTAPYKEKTIMSTRYLTDKYDVKTLIDAIPLVLNKTPDARFLIVGEGEKRHFFEAEVKNTGYADRVEFLGTMPNEKMPDVLNRASIYVSTSPSDGLSISLLEAMACGLFPVLTDIPGNREVVSNGVNGLLFPAGDAKKLAEAIIFALNNREMALSSTLKNRLIIEDKFSMNKNLSGMEDIYLSILK